MIKSSNTVFTDWELVQASGMFLKYYGLYISLSHYTLSLLRPRCLKPWPVLDKRSMKIFPSGPPMRKTGDVPLPVLPPRRPLTD